MDPPRRRLERAWLYLVVEARPRGRDAEPLLRAALENGADVVQLREKESEDEGIVDAARLFRHLTDEYGALFIVNDRPDLARLVEADGVHVGQEDMAVEDVRTQLGGDALIGLSTHSREQIEAAAGVDYISVGPVWETPTKPGRSAVGLELVAWAAEHAPVPFFAIGGIELTNVADIVAAGAKRIAVVRAIRDAADPGATALKFRRAVTGAPAAARQRRTNPHG